MSRDLVVAELPVREVLLSEDRGLITRSGTISWPGGAGIVRITGVAEVIADATLQVEVLSGTLALSRAAIERRWVPVADRGDALLKLRAAAMALGKHIHEQERLVRHSRQRLQRAAGLLERYLERISWLVSVDQADPAAWSADLALTEAQLSAALTADHAAQESLRSSQTELAALARAREEAAAGWTLQASAVLSVDGPAGDVELSLRYLVPSAVWRPSYEASAEADGASVAVTVMATVWQRTGEDWSGARLVLSTARPSTGATLPPLHIDRLSLRDKTAEERRTIQAAFHEQQQHSASLADAGLPGVSDGGEAQSLTAEGLVSVPSDGRPRQVTIARFSANVEPRFICMPEQKALVFGSVRMQNPTAGPLLAGPVMLLRDGGPCGVAALPYVGPGEAFTLSLGSQDDVSVSYTRDAEIERRTMLGDRRWLTQRAVLTRTGPGPEEVELVLRVPISDLAQVRVVLDREQRTSPDATGPDEQGFVRWQVSLPLGASATRTLAFRLDRDSSVQLSDPW